MTFGDNLKRAREQAGITQEELAKKIGRTKGAISSWETEAYQPSSNSLRLLASALNVTVARLLGESASTPIPGAIPITSSGRATMPVRGYVHAGDPDEAYTDDYVLEVPQAVYDSHKNGFLLRVRGNCMDKIYPDGCHVVVDPDITPSSGSIAVVQLDGGDVVMRRMLKGASTLILSPESHDEALEDIVITGHQEVTLIGTVVWFQASEEME